MNDTKRVESFVCFVPLWFLIHLPASGTNVLECNGFWMDQDVIEDVEWNVRRPATVFVSTVIIDLLRQKGKEMIPNHGGNR